MPNGRIALRVSRALVAEIDRVAATESRSRTNWITRVLCEVAPLPLTTIKALQRTAADKREFMLSFRLPDKVIGKLDKVAQVESRTRSDVILRLMTAAVRQEWRGELTARRREDRPPTELEAGVFA